MCPVCLTTMALIAAGAGSAGGLAMVVAKRIRTKPAAEELVPGTPESPAKTEEQS